MTRECDGRCSYTLLHGFLWDVPQHNLGILTGGGNDLVIEWGKVRVENGSRVGIEQWYLLGLSAYSCHGECGKVKEKVL